MGQTSSGWAITALQARSRPRAPKAGFQFDRPLTASFPAVSDPQHGSRPVRSYGGLFFGGSMSKDHVKAGVLIGIGIIVAINLLSFVLLAIVGS